MTEETDHSHHGPNGPYSEVFDESMSDTPKPPQTVHRIRANSSIMHLKKILGEPLSIPQNISTTADRLRPQLLIEEKFVSTALCSQVKSHY